MTRSLLFLLLAASFASADEKLKGIACRSVHLGYPGPEGVAFYNEMSIVKSPRPTPTSWPPGG